MRESDDRLAEGEPRKRPYVAPKLERLGTIGELTHGLGNNDDFDGSHPPGQNKSIIRP